MLDFRPMDKSCRISHLQRRSLEAETIAGFETVAAEEVGSSHGAFAGGLKFLDFERGVGGGDEEAGRRFDYASRRRLGR